MTTKTVIGSVPYLNARPLVRWFTDTEEGRAAGIEVVEAVPTALAVMLERGEVAAALVSSFEMFRRPGLSWAAGTGVTANGPVLSVRMLSTKPVAAVRSVALDTSSVTSVALLKILLMEQYGLSPQYLPSPPNLPRMLASADAALIIGDLGYREYDPSLHVLDLGAAWRELTGLPFVYALWIGPKDTLTPPLVAALTKAREWGTAHLEEVARAEYERVGENYRRVYDYLAKTMRYPVGPREEAALRLFAEKSVQHGLLPSLPRVEAVTPI